MSTTFLLSVFVFSTISQIFKKWKKVRQSYGLHSKLLLSWSALPHPSASVYFQNCTLYSNGTHLQSIHVHFRPLCLHSFILVTFRLQEHWETGDRCGRGQMADSSHTKHRPVLHTAVGLASLLSVLALWTRQLQWARLILCSFRGAAIRRCAPCAFCRRNAHWVMRDQPALSLTNPARRWLDPPMTFSR